MAAELPPRLRERSLARRIRRLRKPAEVILPAVAAGMIGYFALPALDTYPGIANFGIGFYWGIVGEFAWEMATDYGEKKS